MWSFRKRFFNINNMKDLFENVNMGGISFLSKEKKNEKKYKCKRDQYQIR